MVLKLPKSPKTGSDDEDISENMPLLTVLCYRGVEIIVAAIEDSSEIQLICARTRKIFGIIKLPYSEKTSESTKYIKQLHANSFTGLISVVSSFNEVFLYSPQSNLDQPFGPFQWVPHNPFGSENVIDYFASTEKKRRESSVSVISSYNWRVLIACGNTIVVFDTKLYNKSCSSKPDDTFKLLWSTKLSKNIRQADLSGDGNAIAIILNDPDQGKTVSTFRASHENGFLSYPSDIALNLSYHVSHISFRGRGFVWNDDISFSDNNHGITVSSTGNDLLLTCNDKEGYSHVFSQVKWKECASWIGPANSRTVWVHGIGMANLGDLDLKFAEQNTRHTASVNGNDILSRSPGNHRKGQISSPSKQSTDICGLPGTWLAEVTIQGHYPALRLSHLVFGEDGSILPELVEGPATILPASSLSTASMMRTSSSLWIQGIWPTWYNQDNFPRDEGGVPVYLPPVEIRLVAAQREDCFSLLEIPLCMDEGIPETAEFRPPLRYVLNVRPLYLPSRGKGQALSYNPVCTNYMSSKLCAETSQSITDGRVISLTWIGEGSFFVSSMELNNECSDFVGEKKDEDKPINKISIAELVDFSAMPLCVILPSLRIGSRSDETIASLNWWPNQNFGGVPRLLVLTTMGTISLYELPSPFEALEPPTPMFDPIGVSNHSYGTGSSVESYDDDDDDSDDLSLGLGDREYEVGLTPHPDFGIGLRLEAQQDGLPAIVGSYKKHPLSGRRLPAEKNGMIMVRKINRCTFIVTSISELCSINKKIGDELIAVNDEILCNLSFDEIIAAVRRIGSNSNDPLRMRFRSTLKHVEQSDTASVVSNGSRRTLEDILGVKKRKRKKKPKSDQDDVSVATGVMMLGGGELKPEEWVKTLLKSRDVFKEISPLSCASILPMNYGAGSPSKGSGLSAVLVIAIGGNKMIACRLELDETTDEATFKQIGSLTIDTIEDIMHTTPVKTATPGWCLTTVDRRGNAFLIFIDTEESIKSNLVVSFRQYPIFKLDSHVSGGNFVVKAASVNLLVTKNGGNTNDVTVWSSNPMSVSDGKDYYNYEKCVVSVKNAENILDVQWIQSGFLDAYPWLLVFGTRSVYAFYRAGGQSTWKNIAELAYPIPKSLKFQGNMSPADAFPHLIPCLCSMLNVNDEQISLVSDWNIDAIVSAICTDDCGVNCSLSGSVKSVYSWLSKWLSDDKSSQPLFSQKCALSVIPLVKLEPEKENDTKGDVSKVRATESNSLRINLQNVLKARLKNHAKEDILIQDELPLPLRELSNNELEAIWAVGEIISKPPDFSNLDLAGELYVFAMSLFKLLKNSDVERNLDQHISSGAVLAALHSDSQKQILSAIRTSGLNMSWDTMRALMIPLWLRNANDLRAIAEEVAQYTFRSTKRAMDCMLFYIVLNKKNIFINYAKADRSDEGQKLVTFLSNFDFSTPRGRNAAEKNAFSLLRKRRYFQAASFFLMAEPPMLISALNIIVTQMKDLSLAMLVARLMERKSDENVGIIRSFTNFVISAAEKSNTSFQKWKSELGKQSLKIFESQGLELIEGNSCLESLIYFWLNKKHEAVLRISSAEFDNPAIFCTGVSDDEDLTALNRTNGLIDFTSRPFLLRQSMANQRVQWSTALRLSRALSRRGIELSSMKTLLQDTQFEAEDSNIGPQSILTKKTEIKSSALDSYDAAHKSTTTQTDTSTVTNGIKSSIFDSFDAPNTAKALQQDQAVHHTGMGSPIFDSFDRPPQKPIKSANQLDTGTMQSSIFDSYETPQPASVLSSEMSSSIFDSFDVTLHQEKVLKASDTKIQSPIFDSYEVSKKPSSVPSGEMNSSIFNSFNAPLQQKQPVKSSNTETMQSSIFDDYEVPMAKTKINNQSASNTPELDSYCSIQDLQNGEKGDKSSNHVQPLSNNLNFVPPLWNEWKETLLADIVARRILREIGFIVSRMQGDLPITPLELWSSPDHNSIQHDTAQILQHRYEGNLLEGIEKSLNKFCYQHHVEVDAVIEIALLLLGCPNTARRIVIAVILYRLMKRMDLAEILIRNTSRSQIRMCSSFALCNDRYFVKAGTNQFFKASTLARRQAAYISWQLELCLWLNRGGLFELSDHVQKEATVAVRVGLLIAAWGRSFYDLEQLSKCEPDCSLNLSLAQELWRSVKSISLPSRNEASGVHSGGWEFLVDCSRQEASQILTNRKPGSFLLRPHSKDSSVFTLSFRSNVDENRNDKNDEISVKEGNEGSKPNYGDVVQHAIVRLSDLGFRCGSFGPFPTLIKLLDAVSGSLPYGLLLDEPPVQALIQDEGKQPSPNSVLIRKLTMHSRPDRCDLQHFQGLAIDENERNSLRTAYGAFAALLLLNNITKHLCAIVTGATREKKEDTKAISIEGKEENDSKYDSYLFDDCDSLVESLVEDNKAITGGARVLRPIFEWRRSLEARLVPIIIPFLSQSAANIKEDSVNNYDVIIRKLIKPGSGVEVRTLRVGEGTHSAVVVLFSESEAIDWLIRSQVVRDEDEAASHLNIMVKNRVIEPICLKELSALSSGKVNSYDKMEKDIRYRFVDPWEIEAFESKSGSDSQGAMLGRERYIRLNMTNISRVIENTLNSIGGYALVSSWSVNDGIDVLNNAISHSLPPWERSSNGDCEGFYDTYDGPKFKRTNYMDSIRRYLYKNSAFRRLSLPQRFTAIIQIELLDLKNLTSPGGAPSLIAYALLRLKRSGKGSPLTHRIRTLDSAGTEPAKIDRSSGPNPSASWRSTTRFRFPLPEQVDSFGICHNKDREALFPGPPSMLQLSVYEKKFITDSRLGSADIKLDGLSENGCLEEWVPLRSGKDGVVWFARMRISLKFKLLCIAPADELEDPEQCPSVGLTKIKKLSQHGAYEDLQSHANASLDAHKRSVSTPDLLGHLVH